MTDRYQNKYRIASHRMPHWDYSGNGVYFITLVCQNRECVLGQIVNNEMILSDFGKIVEHEWLQSFKIRNELLLDTYIIMPNHIHAIVVIDKNETNDDETHDDETNDGETHDRDETNDGEMNGRVETHGRASLRPQSNNPLMRLPKSISSFIAGFKSAVNSKIDDYIDEHNLDIPKYNRQNHFFQPNYHDHIIHNNTSYQNISEYIINNPLKWDTDNINPINSKNDSSEL